MDIISLIQTVFRRWYVVVPTLLITLGVAFFVNANTPPQFQATGQILLASPELNPERLPRTAVDVESLAGDISTDPVQADLVESGAELAVSVRGTSLRVEATGPTDDVVVRTFEVAFDWLSGSINDRQAEARIPADERLQLAEPDVLEPEERETGDFEIARDLTFIDPTAAADNPYGANNPTARILIVAVQSDAGRERVSNLTGPDVQFSVDQAARDAAPIMNVQTLGTDPIAVLDGFDHITDVIEVELNEREARADVPETRRTAIERIAAPQLVSDVSQPISRAVAAILGLGGLLALGLAVLFESIASRRGRRSDAALGNGAVWTVSTAGNSVDSDAGVRSENGADQATDSYAPRASGQPRSDDGDPDLSRVSQETQAWSITPDRGAKS